MLARDSQRQDQGKELADDNAPQIIDAKGA